MENINPNNAALAFLKGLAAQIEDGLADVRHISFDGTKLEVTFYQIMPNLVWPPKDSTRDFTGGPLYSTRLVVEEDPNAG